MKYSINDTTLTSIANAIRTQKSTTDNIKVSDIAQEILNFPVGKCILLIDEGDVVFTENNRFQDIVHELGVIPQYIRVWTDELDDVSVSTDTMVEQRDYDNIIDGEDGAGTSKNKRATDQMVVTSFTRPTSATSVKVKINSGTSSRVWASGIVYHYKFIAGIRTEED